MTVKVLEQPSLSIHCSLGILSDLLCSSWDQAGSERSQWSWLEAGLAHCPSKYPQLAAGLRGSQDGRPGIPVGRLPSSMFVCLQATMVCDLVLLYLDAKADLYWKEKFEEVRRGPHGREEVLK